MAGRERALGLGYGIRGAAHGLDTPAHVDVGLPEHHGPRGVRHRLEARAAQAVDGSARGGLGETREQERHARHVAVVLPGLVGAT